MKKLARRKSSLLYETELSWFILVCALDVFMTYIILRYSAQGRTRSVMIEGNPIARWILHQWGIPGMVIFKFLIVGFVAAVAEFAGRRKPSLGRSLLHIGTIVVGGVVIYSFFLLRNNM